MLRATIASLLAIASTGSALAQARDTPRNDSDTSYASADQVRQEFSIAAQPVSQALRAYAQQSGDQVVFYSNIGKGRESAADDVDKAELLWDSWDVMGLRGTGSIDYNIDGVFVPEDYSHFAFTTATVEMYADAK